MGRASPVARHRHVKCPLDQLFAPACAHQQFNRYIGRATSQMTHAKLTMLLYGYNRQLSSMRCTSHRHCPQWLHQPSTSICPDIPRRAGNVHAQLPSFLPVAASGERISSSIIQSYYYGNTIHVIRHYFTPRIADHQTKAIVPRHNSIRMASQSLIDVTFHGGGPWLAIAFLHYLMHRFPPASLSSLFDAHQVGMIQGVRQIFTGDDR